MCNLKHKWNVNDLKRPSLHRELQSCFVAGRKHLFCKLVCGDWLVFGGILQKAVGGGSVLGFIFPGWFFCFQFVFFGFLVHRCSCIQTLGWFWSFMFTHVYTNQTGTFPGLFPKGFSTLCDFCWESFPFKCLNLPRTTYSPCPDRLVHSSRSFLLICFSFHLFSYLINCWSSCFFQPWSFQTFLLWNFSFSLVASCYVIKGTTKLLFVVLRLIFFSFLTELLLWDDVRDTLRLFCCQVLSLCWITFSSERRDR